MGCLLERKKTEANGGSSCFMMVSMEAEKCAACSVRSPPFKDVPKIQYIVLSHMQSALQAFLAVGLRSPIQGSTASTRNSLRT